MAAAASRPAWLPLQVETEKAGIIHDGMAYNERLFHYTHANRRDEVHVLDNRMLHRLNIFHLQNRLAKLRGSIWTAFDASDTDLADLKIALHEYSKQLYFRSFQGST